MNVIFVLLVFGHISQLTICVDFHEKEKEILDYNLSPERYDTRVRPPGTNGSDGSPVIVRVNLFVRSIAAIDDQKMEYSVQLTFRQQWIDPRLKYDSQNGQLRFLTLTKPNHIWEPDLYFSNENSGHFHDMMAPNLFFRILPDGSIMYSKRISLTLGCEMDLKLYPFDEQTCAMQMASYGYTTKDLVFLWRDKVSVQIAKNLYIAKFNIQNVSQEHCDIKLTTGNYSCIKTEFLFKRSSFHYFIQIYLPSIVMVLLSFTTFWFSPTAIQSRMILGLSTLLGLVIRTSVVSSEIPQVSYVKSVDIWTGICITFVFLAYLEFCTVQYLYRSKRFNAVAGKPDEADLLQNDLDGDGENDITMKSLNCSGQLLTPNSKCTIREQIHNLSCFEIWFKRFSHRAKTIDVLARIFFPTSFLVFNLIYWLYYTA